MHKGISKKLLSGYKPFMPNLFSPMFSSIFASLPDLKGRGYFLIEAIAWKKKLSEINLSLK